MCFCKAYFGICSICDIIAEEYWDFLKSMKFLTVYLFTKLINLFASNSISF